MVAGGDAAAVRGGGADGVAVRFDALALAAAALSGREAASTAEQARASRLRGTLQSGGWLRGGVACGACTFMHAAPQVRPLRRHIQVQG